MLLLAVVVVCGGRAWARSLEDKFLEDKVLEDVQPAGKVDLGDNLLREVVRFIEANGNFSSLVEYRSIMENATRGIQTWLKEYIEDDEQGRHFKRKRMMMHMFMWLKAVGLGLVLPLAVAAALLTAWKGVTISLLAFMLAGVVWIKQLVSTVNSKDKPQHVILSGVPSHHDHYWRRRSDPPHDDYHDAPSWPDASSHRLVYRAYTT